MRFPAMSLEDSASRITEMPESSIGEICREAKRKVDFTIFAWAIGIIFLAVAGVVGSVTALSSKVEKVDETNTTLGKDVASIKTDVSWIRSSLSEINVNQSKNTGGSSPAQTGR